MIPTALDVLREVEWSGDTTSRPACPSCEWTQPNHNPDCRLAAVLSGAAPAPAPDPPGGRLSPARIVEVLGLTERQSGILLHEFANAIAPAVLDPSDMEAAREAVARVAALVGALRGWRPSCGCHGPHGRACPLRHAPRCATNDGPYGCDCGADGTDGR